MKNLKYITTKKLKEILDSNHCTGVNGKDYAPVKEELEQILWARLADNEINTDDYFSVDSDNVAC